VLAFQNFFVVRHDFTFRVKIDLTDSAVSTFVRIAGVKFGLDAGNGSDRRV
jgi:hypothetical protein